MIKLLFFFTGDLHGQLEDLLLVFYKVSMSVTRPLPIIKNASCRSGAQPPPLPPPPFLLLERFTVSRDAIRLQRRLCGPREKLHRDSAHPVRLPVGVSQRGPPQQRKPRRPHRQSEVHGRLPWASRGTVCEAN